MKFRILSPDETIWPIRYPWEFKEGGRPRIRKRKVTKAQFEWKNLLRQFVGKIMSVGKTKYKVGIDGAYRRVQ
jgi:hypothetical protein